MKDGVRLYGQDEHRVTFKGRLTTPSFTSKGAGLAYLDLLRSGLRQPEYVAEVKREHKRK